MKFPLLLLSSWLFLASGSAQTGIITGNLEDKENGKSSPGITVALTAFYNPLLPVINISDETGTFIFENLPHGYYSISFRLVGYATLKLDSIHVREERNDFNLGVIRLTRSATELEEVMVYIEKPLIENKDGKITFNRKKKK